MTGTDRSLGRIEEQLDGVQPAEDMAAVHAELGSSPAPAEDFARLAEEMSKPDGCFRARWP